MKYARDPREIAIRERRDAYADVHRQHSANKAAEIAGWLAALDAVTEQFRDRIQPEVAA